MRDFFIKSLEWIINIVVVLAAVGIAVVAIGAMFGGVPVGEYVIEGPMMAAAVAVGGVLCLMVVAGALYLGLGIYNNTRRMADTLELLLTLRGR